MKKPRVSVIISNWNGWKDTIEALESLYKIDYPNYEVIVVDNASKDGSIKKIKDWAKGKIKVKSKFFVFDIKNKPIKYLEYTKKELDKGAYLIKKKKLDKLKSNKKLFILKNDKNNSWSGANNLAMKQVLKEKKSKYIFLFNNDAVIDKDALTELVKVIESNKKIGIVGGKIYSYFEKRKDMIQSVGVKINLAKGDVYLYGQGKQDKGQFDKIREVDFICGASLLIKPEVLKKVGLVDERFFMYFDDPDWCIKIKKAGYLILIVPKSIIWHKGAASLKKLSGYGEYYATRNRLWFVRKHANLLQLILFFAYFIFFLSYMKFGKYMLRKDRKSLIKGYLRGLKDGFGVNKII